MTPQFIRNLHTIGEMSLTLWFGCVAVVFLLAYMAWKSTKLLNEPYPVGAQTMLGLLGMLCFSAAAVLPAMMVIFRVWAFFYFR